MGQTYAHENHPRRAPLYEPGNAGMTEPVARTVKEFCRAYGISRTLTYELIAAGELVAVKAGRRTLIREDSARQWFESLAAHGRA